MKQVLLFVGLVAFLFICLALRVVFMEWDYRYKSRISRASVDMEVIRYASDLYRMKYGRYPRDLSDLEPGPTHSSGDVCFLPSSLLMSPWDSPYHLEVKRGGEGESISLWTIPDEKTQQRLHTVKFTGDPHPLNNSWPGDPALASADAKAGIPCDSAQLQTSPESPSPSEPYRPSGALSWPASRPAPLARGLRSTVSYCKWVRASTDHLFRLVGLLHH